MLKWSCIDTGESIRKRWTNYWKYNKLSKHWQRDKGSNNGSRTDANQAKYGYPRSRKVGDCDVNVTVWKAIMTTKVQNRDSTATVKTAAKKQKH